MKKCEVCNSLGKVHYRVKSINHKTWIFSVKIVWKIFLSKGNIVTVEQENLNLYNLKIDREANLRNFNLITFY